MAVELTGASWNRFAAWLRHMPSLREVS